MYLTAEQCILTMKILYEFENQPLYLNYSIQILAATSLELLAKDLIFYRMIKAGENLTKIRETLKNFGHNLQKLYSNEGVGVYFSKKSGIRNISIKRYSGNLFPQYYYEFTLYKRSEPLKIYDSESIKYGLLSVTKANKILVGKETRELLKLCERVEKLQAKETERHSVNYFGGFKKRLNTNTF